jgi:hypothetical protein
MFTSTRMVLLGGVVVVTVLLGGLLTMGCGMMGGMGGTMCAM